MLKFRRQPCKGFPDKEKKYNLFREMGGSDNDPTWWLNALYPFDEPQPEVLTLLRGFNETGVFINKGQTQSVKASFKMRLR